MERAAEIEKKVRWIGVRKRVKDGGGGGDRRIGGHGGNTGRKVEGKCL